MSSTRTVRAARGRRRVSAWAVALAAIVASGAPAARGADHMDSPRTKEFAPLDINDVYVFRSPVNPNNTVMIATLVPFAGFLAPTQFSTLGDVEFKIDNTGDFMEDLSFRFSFSQPNRRSVQRVSVERVGGTRSALLGQGLTGRTFALPGNVLAVAGLFDDPFFFDLNAFNAFKATEDPGVFCKPGHNFFANANVMAIVLEVPTRQLLATAGGATSINLWVTTSINGEQFDRMGRPAINTVLIPANLKDAFNSGVPHTDPLLFFDTVVATLTALKNPPIQAQILAKTLLPDVNSFDSTNPMGFPNGRRLSDDVIDAEFQLLLSGLGVTTDCVGNDSEFNFRFPYLAVANRYGKH